MLKSHLGSIVAVVRSLNGRCTEFNTGGSIFRCIFLILLVFSRRFLADRFVEGTCPFCNFEVTPFRF